MTQTLPTFDDIRQAIFDCPEAMALIPSAWGVLTNMERPNCDSRKGAARLVYAVFTALRMQAIRAGRQPEAWIPRHVPDDSFAPGKCDPFLNAMFNIGKGTYPEVPPE